MTSKATHPPPWGPLLMSTGWTAVPFVILQYQAELKLDALNLNLILQIAKHWWQRDQLPFPAVGSLARAMGVSKRTVQRRLKDLEHLGYIKRHRHGSRKSNAYSLEGLVKAAEPLVEEEQSRRLSQTGRNGEESEL